MEGEAKTLQRFFVVLPNLIIIFWEKRKQGVCLCPVVQCGLHDQNFSKDVPTLLHTLLLQRNMRIFTLEDRGRRMYNDDTIDAAGAARRNGEKKMEHRKLSERRRGAAVRTDRT